MREVAESSGMQLISVLEDDTALFDSGLDSLGFAVLIVRLEEELGYDPFVLMDEPIYPQTLGDFVAIYEQFKK